MKIGLAQVNTTVGDLTGNRSKMRQAYADLVRRGAELVVFPELVICGYPPRDLLLKSRFIEDCGHSLDAFAETVGDVPAIVGTVERNRALSGRPCLNILKWVEQGRSHTIAQKSLLPTYDVFDEDRYFEPAQEPGTYQWKDRLIGLTICEDIWKSPEVATSNRYHADPIARLADLGVDLIINCSASPWHLGKDAFRINLVCDAARRARAPVVYCNAVGGNDELIFDGKSFATDAGGNILASAPAFAEETLLVDLNAEPTPGAGVIPEPMAELEAALTLGLRDYAQKTGFQRALIGLSGGIDSALTAYLAVQALGAENVIGVSLPSPISSQHSKDDAQDLARNLGITFHTLPIASVVSAGLSTLEPLFAGLPTDVTEENIQARARGLLLMALSNKFRALLLTTGNKSELAVGYCTLYGDMCGGLAVISDVPKTVVFALCRHINRAHEIIPENTLTKPPSAELRPDQRDEDSLPPYPVLDAILERYVERGLSSVEIAQEGYDLDLVREIVRKVDLNEYKRKQAAPGLKVTPLAFGVGRRIPIVQRYVS